MTETKEKLFDLAHTGLTDEQLFQRAPQDAAAVEKIVAPRYSYWRSVGRVFFSKKSNILVIAMMVLILVVYKV